MFFEKRLVFYGHLTFFDRTKEGLSKESIASLSTTFFGGLMLGRALSGLVSEKLGDKINKNWLNYRNYRNYLCWNTY